jgi:hypothetical protein
MAVSGVAFGDAALRAAFEQRREDFKSMVEAVAAGDITAAQTALAAYQKDVQALQPDPAESPATSGYSGNAKIQTDLSTLTSAIGAGNIQDAQSTLVAYEQDRSDAVDPQLIKDTVAGDASAAQADQASLGADLEALLGGGQVAGTSHHHHHHQAPPVDQAAAGDVTESAGADASSSTPQGTGASDASAVVASFVQDLSTLLKDAVAGDASAVSGDAAKLAADLGRGTG